MNRPSAGGGALRRGVAAGAVVAGAAAFALFYNKYVPLVPGFQAVLAPVLAAVFFMTFSGVGRGLVALVFALPLINSLPYFFGITEHIPHAPTALPLVLAFALGLAARAAFFPEKEEERIGEPGGAYDGRPDEKPAPERRLPLRVPIALFSGLVVVSAVVTAFRYAGFYPFAADEVLEIVVNAGGVRTGGAIMSVVFNGLSYPAGFLVFSAVRRAAGGRALSERLLRILTVAVFPALLFAAYQAWRAPGLGNTPFWERLGQINGTFKDPNSLAGFAAAFVPVALGLALAARGRLRKLFPLAAAVLSVGVIPQAGSRSGLAGLAAGLIVFGCVAAVSLRGDGRGRRARRIKTAPVVAVAAGAVVLAVLFLGFFGSTLADRMTWGADVLKGDMVLDGFFNFRLTLWASAIRMTAAYPLSGVGVGGYIIELPNILAEGGRFTEGTDSALNYVLQVGAELGLPGLVLIVWILAGVAGRMIRAVRTRPVDFAALGTASGLAAFFVVFLFHTFIGSFEVIVFFWLLAGLLFRMTDGRAGDTGDKAAEAEVEGRESESWGAAAEGDETESDEVEWGEAGRTEDGRSEGLPGDGRGEIDRSGAETEGTKSERGKLKPGKRRAVAWIAGVAGMAGVLAFGAVHLRNSLGTLSVERRTEEFGWVQDFGFYGREIDDRGYHFRWSGARVGLAVPDVGVPLVLPVTAMHPDIAERPVRIRIHRADRKFRPGEFLLEHVQRDKEWTEIEIFSCGPGDGRGAVVRAGESAWIRVIIEVDRTWSPQRDLGVPDPRELGFAVGEPWYRHPGEPPGEGRVAREETFSDEDWVGYWGSTLFTNGVARLGFLFEPAAGEADGAVLVLKLRGDPAEGGWPFAVIRLDGRVIGRTFVTSEAWTPVVLYPEMAPGERTLSVEFTNDFINHRTGADRNLHLGPLRLLYLTQKK